MRLAEVAFAVKAFRGNSELTLTLPSLPWERPCPGLGSGPCGPDWLRLQHWLYSGVRKGPCNCSAQRGRALVKRCHNSKWGAESWLSRGAHL